jgi:hypothetical protein
MAVTSMGLEVQPAINAMAAAARLPVNMCFNFMVLCIWFYWDKFPPASIELHRLKGRNGFLVNSLP